MSGTELDPDGTDSYHPQHPWEQTTHPMYRPPHERTRHNWPPEDAVPAGAHEAGVWRALPLRTPEPRLIHTTGGLPVTADHEPGVVTLEVGRGTRMPFDPKDAAELGQQLLEQAQNAIHAERVGRRKTT